MPDAQSGDTAPTREQVVAALAVFVKERGITHPDDLPLDDPDVKAAHQLEFAWGEAAQQRAAQSAEPDALQRYSADRCMLYFDAGYTDRDYLEEVAFEWLDRDLELAEEAGLNDLAEEIRAKINVVLGWTQE